MSPSKKRIPVGLARVRKALPPPGKAFKNKRDAPRKQAKDLLRQELKEARKRTAI